MIPLIAAVAGLIGLAVGAVADQRVSYFPVPSGAHPHDVSPGPGGLVWYTAQFQGALGILDPKTGKVEQVPLGRGSSPHGVIMGPDGAAWGTAAVGLASDIRPIAAGDLPRDPADAPQPTDEVTP